jgi:long-chain acyl-CoA synthetase
MPNVLQYPVAIAGCHRAGLVVVNVNPLYTARELEHQLKDSGATAIVIFENAAAKLQQVLAHTPVKHIVVTGIGDLLGFPKGAITNFVIRKVRKMVPAYALPGVVRFNDALAAGGALTLDPVEVTGEDVAFLQHTGGTTGVSKSASRRTGTWSPTRRRSSRSCRSSARWTIRAVTHGAAALPYLRADDEHAGLTHVGATTC